MASQSITGAIFWGIISFVEFIYKVITYLMFNAATDLKLTSEKYIRKLPISDIALPKIFDITYSVLAVIVSGLINRKEPIPLILLYAIPAGFFCKYYLYYALIKYGVLGYPLSHYYVDKTVIMG